MSKSKTKRIFLITRDEILKVSPDKIICLDTEGFIRELTIIDGNENVKFHGVWEENINTPKGIRQIQKILADASFIVGHSINFDLQRLGDLGFRLAPNTICIDIQPIEKENLEYIYTLETGTIPKEVGTLNQTPSLNHIAALAKIPLPDEGVFHESKFDAIVTLRIFKLFLEKGLAHFKYIENPNMDRDYSLQIPCADKEPKTENTDILENGAEKESNIMNHCDFENNSTCQCEWKNTEIRYGVGFNEALLYKDCKDSCPILVRLNDFEMSCLDTIRKINPNYSLASFYFDIILPGRKNKIEQAIEEERSKISSPQKVLGEINTKPSVINRFDALYKDVENTNRFNGAIKALDKIMDDSGELNIDLDTPAVFIPDACEEDLSEGCVCEEGHDCSYLEDECDYSDSSEEK